MLVRDACPTCDSTRFKKNGCTHNGKQQYHCKTCPRQCVPCAEPYRLSEETRALIQRLLVERIALRGMCRAGGVGLKGLLGFRVQCIAALPDPRHGEPVSCNANVPMQCLANHIGTIQDFICHDNRTRAAA